jgi:hypothetical protein
MLKAGLVRGVDGEYAVNEILMILLGYIKKDIKIF